MDNTSFNPPQSDIELRERMPSNKVDKLPEEWPPNGKVELDDELEEEDPGWFMKMVGSVQESVVGFYNAHKKRIEVIIMAAVLIGFHVYLGAAMWYDHNKAVGLLVMTCFTWAGVGYWGFFLPNYSTRFNDACCVPLLTTVGKAWSYRGVKWGTYLLLLVAVAVFLALDTRDDRFRLISLGGLIIYLLLLFIFSKNPARIRWQPVIWGIALQFIFGLLILRWSVGKNAFKWLADKVTSFLGYVDAGTSFTYGYLAAPTDKMQEFGMNAVFAFATIPVVIFFSAFVSVLYYLGVMQFVIVRIGWFMQITMGTTAAESMNAAGNIFIGQTEAPLMVRPYLHKLTKSEIHAIMTGGFATIAGSVFAAYVRFGACASHLLSASIMSAPAALAVSKLFYPETEKSQTKTVDDLKLEKGTEKNALEAASNGATQAIFLVENIIANLIVFLAFLAFFNDVLVWLGEMVGVECLTFEKLMSYIFFPLAYMMGASSLPDPAERRAEVLKVAELMGIKTFLNEFVAYQRLGKMIHCGVISARAQMIATYALCGFSNISSVGMTIGGLAAMAPSKKQTLAEVGMRALVAGSIACFMTACVAGNNDAQLPRATMVSTYALCGFSNIASIGVQVGGLSAICSDKRNIFSEVAIRALIAGTVACFMTACIAGILSDAKTHDCPLSNIYANTDCSMFNSTSVNGTAKCGSY